MSSTYIGDAEASELRSIDAKTLATNQSKNFLEWRYGRNPNYQYREFRIENDRVIFRIKKGVRFNEFRIAEAYFDGKYGRELRSLILQEARVQRAQVITWAGFRLPFLSIPLSVGPMITVNKLQTQFDGLSNWQPTLGDMEVF